MPAHSPARPAPTEYFSFYKSYVDEVPEGDVLDTLVAQRDSTAALLAGVSEADAGFRYAEGKWSIREVAGHVADAERVFAYRALRIARGDPTPLAGFDENAWMPMAGFEARSLADVAAELRAVREATLALFRSIDQAAWGRSAVASGHPVTARALAWIIAGHERHHLRVLGERYLPRLED
ncbi:MAG TPA: DinB family protein [Gemmatimonadales bacterium]|nr:DinB family protein [Gemmatimonadales bacterium]